MLHTSKYLSYTSSETFEMERRSDVSYLTYKYLLAGNYWKAFSSMTGYPRKLQEVIEDARERYYSFSYSYLHLNEEVGTIEAFTGEKLTEQEMADKEFLPLISKILIRVNREHYLNRLQVQRPDTFRFEVEQELKENGDTISQLVETLLEKSKEGTYGYFETLDRLFNSIWTSRELTQYEYGHLTKAFDSLEAPLLRPLIAALLIGCLEHFDIRKCQFLLHVVKENVHHAVASIALLSLLILGRHYQEELINIYEVFTKEVVDLFKSSPQLSASIFKCVYYLQKVYALETQDIPLGKNDLDAPFTFIAKLLKMFFGDDLTDPTTIILHKRLAKKAEIEGIPDQVFSESLHKSIRRVNFALTSSLTKHHFFHKISSWFISFNSQHPQFREDKESEAKHILAQRILGQTAYTVDLYGAILTSKERLEIPKINNIEPKNVQIIENELANPISDFIYSLFSFYHIFYKKNDFFNPFTNTPYVLDGAFTRFPIFNRRELEDLKVLLLKNRQQIALGNTYKRIINDLEDVTQEDWENLIDYYSKKENNEASLECIHSVINIFGLSPTLSRKRSIILESKKRYLEMLDTAQRDQAHFDKENIPAPYTTFAIAKALFQLKRYDEAFAATLKADLLIDPQKDPSILKLLCSILLVTGRATEAYEKTKGIKHEGELNSILLLLLLALGEKEKAFNLLNTTNISDLPLLTHDIRCNASALTMYGYTQGEVHLLLDQIECYMHIRTT